MGKDNELKPNEFIVEIRVEELAHFGLVGIYRVDNTGNVYWNDRGQNKELVN